MTRGLLKVVADDPEKTLDMRRMFNYDLRPSGLLTTSMALRAAARALRDRPRQVASTLGEFVTAGAQTIRRG